MPPVGPDVAIPYASPPNRRVTLALLVAIDLLVVAICVLGAIQSARKATLPFEVRRDLSVLTGDIPGMQAGHDRGARLLSIERYPATNAYQVETILDGRGIGEKVPIVVGTDLHRRDVVVELVPYYTRYQLVVFALGGAIFFGLGLFVLVQRSDDPASHVFHHAMCATTVMIVATGGRITDAPLDLGVPLRACWLLASTTFPVFFVDFTLRFPQSKRRWLRLIPLLYAVGIALGVATSIAFALSVDGSLDIEMFELHHWLKNVSAGFFIACSALSLVSLFHSHRVVVDDGERRKLRWVLFGASIAPTAYIALWMLPRLLEIDQLIGEAEMIMISTVTPIMFTIAIVRHRFLDIDLLISRSTAYALVLGLLVALHAVVLTIATKTIGSYDTSAGGLPTIIGLIVVALLFEPIRSRVQRFVDRRFFRVGYDYRNAQRQISDEIGKSIDLTALASTVAKMLDGVLQLESIALAITAEGGSEITTTSTTGMEDSEARRIASAVVDRANGWILATPGTIEAEIDARPIDPEVETSGIVICASDRPSPTARAVVLLGGIKRSTARFTPEDVDLIRGAVVEAAMAAESIDLQRSLLLKEIEADHLRKLNQLKSYFVSSVSHELKTPLTSIRMFAEMLHDSTSLSSTKVQEYGGIIESETERLARLIDNVLDFSKIERGTRSYHFSRVELKEPVERALRSISGQLNGFDLSVELEDGIVLDRADLDALVQATLNLLSNGIKYSGGRRQLSVRSYASNGHGCISIGDHGIGMSREQMERAFEPFYRAHDPRTASVAGAGLGLALVRHIVDAHGGTIEIDSQPDVGTTITLLIPRNGNTQDSGDRG